jgi:hypothetical protein
MNNKQESSQQQIPGGSQFLVNIRYRQNNSWQGSVQRLDTGETINFRNTMELHHLIETAVDQAESSTRQKKERFRNWKTETGVDGAPDQKNAEAT